MSHTEKGVILGSHLYLMEGPSDHHRKMDALKQGQKADILQAVGSWYQIRTAGRVGYIQQQFISIGGNVSEFMYLKDNETLLHQNLAPDDGHNFTQWNFKDDANLLVGRVWQRYGGLIPVLAQTLNIGADVATAILALEFGGEGFENGRLRIRFEIHKFWRYFGKAHPDQFHNHFVYKLNKPWQRHRFKAPKTGRWIKVHQSQDREWRVFEFARTLDDEAAMHSVRMGAPLIQGDHCLRLGYESPKAMLESFQQDIRFQVLGIFDLIKGPAKASQMFRFLENNDFESFAWLYSGAAKAKNIGTRLTRYCNIYNKTIA